MRAHLLLAFVVLLAACAGASPVHVLAVDPAFTGEEHAALERCRGRWDVVAPGRLVLEGVLSDRNSIVRAPAFDGSSAMGLTAPGRSFVTLHPNLSERGVFESVACHELGHVLGLEHVRGLAVMNAGDVYETELSALDVHECRRVGACETEARSR